MKVYLGPYPRWIGPYQIAEKLMLWKDKYAIVDENDPLKKRTDAADIHRFGKWLATNRKGEDSWITHFCNWLASKKKRKVKIRVDGYDTWNANHTLALIIVPVLKKLQEEKCGAPHVDDEDVPEVLRSTSAPKLSDEQKMTGHSDNNYFERWDWVLNEMIWAFEQSADDSWEEQYYSGKVDWSLEDGVLVEGPNNTFKTDEEGIKKHRERMANGRRLFAKYYECLWS